MNDKINNNNNENKKHKNGLFVFHRDLRIVDNIGLNHAHSICSNVYTTFIFTPEQVSSANKFKSNNAIQFMIECLEELEKAIQGQNGKLLFFYGNTLKIVRKLIKALDIDVIIFNKDYSPYAVARDNELSAMCKKEDITCIMKSDYYLYEPGTIKTSTGNYYKKYTPFYEEVISHGHSVVAPMKLKTFHFAKAGALRIQEQVSLSEISSKLVPSKNTNILVHGGRTNALKTLLDATKSQKHYVQQRDNLIYNTSFLSAHIKFGGVSIREVYYTFVKHFGKSSGIIRELIWREFFAHVLYAFPEVLSGSYQKKYRSIHWSNSEKNFELWKKGKTGFPVVDAGMRQLNSTGYMHNRCRMIVANFLIKTLLIDWRKGEQYFAQKLTDYDPASNNGNWQSISATGVDMKPYFRDMNPWIQCAKFDKNAEYIKKWVPELKNVDPKDIHKWYDAYSKPEYKNVYIKPIVDYDNQKVEMLKMYKNA
jgi:deoxyribodipyrimidine photo-lyase